MALEFYSPFLHDFAGIMFYAETLSPYSEFETSQFLKMIFAVLLSKLLLNLPPTWLYETVSYN